MNPKLLNWGFTAYEAGQTVRCGAGRLRSPASGRRKQPSVKLGRFQPIVVTGAHWRGCQAQDQVVPEPWWRWQNQSLGSLKVIAGDQTVAEAAAGGLEAVEQAGCWGGLGRPAFLDSAERPPRARLWRVCICGQNP